MMPSGKKDKGPGVVDLIEESVHLLRQHPGELAGYYIGAGPFAVTLLYFSSYITWFAPPDGAIAVGALILAILFGVMKAGQHRFAQRLLAYRIGEQPSPWTWRQWFTETAAQLRLQSTGLILVPLAAIFTVPLGWVYAYYQNATVLPTDPKGGSVARRHQAWAQALRWPVQNHWALLILSVLWLMVFLNVGMAFYVLPTLATQWLGLKTIFAISGWSYLNTTFLALVAVLTHLLVDPLIKTFYMLRNFHGLSRETGADLRVILIREKQLGQRLASVLLLLLLLGGSLAPAPLHAAGPAGVKVVQAAPAPALDKALDVVLEQPDFRWRLHPLPTAADKTDEGIIASFFSTSGKMIGHIFKTGYDWIKGAVNWVRELFPAKKDADTEKPDVGTGAPFDWMAALQLVSYLLLFAVIGLLIFVAYKVWQHNRTSVPLKTNAVPSPASSPDLRDENILASHLPVDGWLLLAKQKLAAGEWRLALRALFLATLARHAQEGLVALAKFKTNLDYEAELRRRAHSRTELVADFRDRRRQFEEVWYGDAQANDQQVRDWLQRLEEHA